MLCALAAGVLVFLEWRRGEVSAREVLVLAVVLRVVVFPMTPTLSDDGFRYVWDGMIQAESGVNPYHFAPSDSELSSSHEEFIYEQMNSRDYYSVYPPISQLVFAVSGFLYPFSWLASWYGIKLILLGGELAGLFLLSRMANPRNLLLYAWHPLVVLETAGQGHGEALVVGLLIASIWAVHQTRPSFAGGAIAAAGWVKLVPFVFAPFIVRRLGWRAAVVGFTFTVMLAAPYAESYTIPHVQESLDLYVRSFEFNAGPYLAIKGIAASIGFGDVSKTLGPALQWLFLLSLPIVFVLDWWKSWSIGWAMIIVLSLFLVCSTTVHPWYLVPLLALAPLVMERDAGRWFGLGWAVLGTASMATYWRYAGPSWGYDLAVWLGWILWMSFMIVAISKAGLPRLMRQRASKKWRRIQTILSRPLDSSARVLDLGAGEGFVGEAIHKSTDAQVTLVDVVDFNQTPFPLTLYDGHRLPFEDNSFDLCVVIFVLHHAGDMEQTLREATRVTEGPIAILESVYESNWQHWLLDRLDRLANRIRSAGEMTSREKHLHFRTDAEWRSIFKRLGLHVEHATIEGRWVHQQALYLVQKG